MLSEDELVPFLSIPDTSNKVLGFKEGQSKYFQDLLKANREEWQGENVPHLWLSDVQENTTHLDLLLHLQPSTHRDHLVFILFCPFNHVSNTEMAQY